MPAGGLRCSIAGSALHKEVESSEQPRMTCRPSALPRSKLISLYAGKLSLATLGSFLLMRGLIRRNGNHFGELFGAIDGVSGVPLPAGRPTHMPFEESPDQR